MNYMLSVAAHDLDVNAHDLQTGCCCLDQNFVIVGLDEYWVVVALLVIVSLG
jgi:hypothetical protein